MTLSKGIFAAVHYDHESSTIRLFETLSGAMRWKEEIARDYWECHFPDPPTRDMTDGDIANYYFSHAPENFDVRVFMEVEP